MSPIALGIPQHPVVSADYAKGASYQEGLPELWADCHDGIALKDGTRTWSVMQLERASRFGQQQPSAGITAWRVGSGLLSAKSITNRKTIYYNLCKRIQRQCLEARQACTAPFSWEQALNGAIRGFISSMDYDLTKPLTLTQMATTCPDVDRPHQYEALTLGWRNH
ncbi:hypothetical protein WJX73_007322 [Symbiochloris irregularis]|uniref:Uncharacterized protein n=1 Tax=Symbiochloris irregularis TaxID=706552 RepID=A0AAW1PYV5_9CHLO